MTRRAKYTLGHVRDWHDPHNDECAHNRSVECDCQCKRVVNRKGYTVRRVHDETVPHGYKPDIVVAVYPNGVLKLRELGRKESSAVSFQLGDLYATGVRRRALNELATKRKNAREKRKQKKGRR